MLPEKPQLSSKPANDLARFSGLGLQMAVILGFFAYGGHRLDQYLGNASPWFTIVGCLLGLGLSMAQLLWQLAKQKNS